MLNSNDLDRKTRSAIDLLGGEPLAGSGFESETPESGFDADEPERDGGR